MAEARTEEYAFETRERGNAAAVMWLPTVILGAIVLIAAVVLALINQRSGARFFGMSAEAQAAATLGGSPADLGDLRSFLTLDAWIPGMTFLGAGILLTGIVMAVAATVGSIRRIGDDLQRSFGHAPLGPQPGWAGKVVTILPIVGLVVLVTAFILTAMRAANISDYYSFGAEARAAATGSRLARFGTAQAWGTWLPPFQWLGIGIVASAIGFALLELVEQFRYLGWRLRDLASDQPHESPGAIYVLTRSS